MATWPPVTMGNFVPKDIFWIIADGLIKAVGDKINVALIDPALRAAENSLGCVLAI